MEELSHPSKTVLQTSSKTRFILSFVIFCVAFFIFVIIGVVGPSIYGYVSLSAWKCPSGVNTFEPIVCSGVDIFQNDTIWEGEINNLEILNRELFLTATVTSLENQTAINVDFFTIVNIFARGSETDQWTPILTGNEQEITLQCDAGFPYCQNVSLAEIPFLHYEFYKFNVSFLNTSSLENLFGDIIFTFTYVNGSYTLFEIWLRSIFFFITAGFIWVYLYSMRKWEWKIWTIEQKWITFILFALMGYDNPFYLIEIFADGWFPIVFDRLLYMSFIVLLLLFWLVMFDGIRQETKDFYIFYLPKIVLSGLLWISGIIVYTWNEYTLRAQNITESPGFIFFQVLMLILVVIYLLWLLYAFCRICTIARTLPHLDFRTKCFGFFTFMVSVVVIGGIIFGGVVGPYNSAAEFLSFLALFNLYCYMMAVLYVPSKSGVAFSDSSTKTHDGMVRLEDENDQPIIGNLDISPKVSQDMRRSEEFSLEA